MAGVDLKDDGNVTEKLIIGEETDDVDDWSFVKDSGQHDSTLLVDGHKIHVASSVLCIASPVFRAMFQSDFNEKHQQEIKLPEKKYEDVAEFLKCIYPDTLKCITEDNVYQILPLVVEYQTKVLQDRCQKILIENVRRNPKDVVKHIGLAELYNMEDLRQVCVYIASERPLECTEQMEVVISTKSLLQIHVLYVKKNNLDMNDDRRLYQDCYIWKNTLDKNLSSCVQVKQALGDYLRKSLSADCQNARLIYRHAPEHLHNNEQLLRDCNDKAKGIDIDERLSLLPESIKQQLDWSEDKRKKYLYPPLPDVPMLEFKYKTQK